MKVDNSWILLVFLGALPFATMTGCGRTTENPRTGSGGISSQGGAPGLGGKAGAGGSGGAHTTETTVVTPRPPATHRPVASSCVGVNSPAEPGAIMYPEQSQCTRHADCTEGTNGKCVNGIGMAGMIYSCVYDQCATDADCDAGMVCHCNGSTPARCLSFGNCQTDADCGGGGVGYCSPSMGWDCGGYHTIDSYHCHTPADSCMDDTDCTGRDYCNYDEYDGRWKCTPINQSCIIG